MNLECLSLITTISKKWWVEDYSNAIVEAVKKKLNKPDLQVKLIPITSQNRIPLLQNGTFDFECGSTTNNVKRKNRRLSLTLFSWSVRAC